MAQVEGLRRWREAKTDDLIDEIADSALREGIANEVRDLGETKRFGLVFEEQISPSAATEASDSGSQSGSQ